MKLNEVIAKYGNADVDESKIKEVLGVNESKVWKPKRDDVYWFIDDDGEPVRTSRNAQKLFAFGNCYKTFDEAEFARDKQIFLIKFERYLRENEDEPVDWSDFEQNKHCIRLEHCNNNNSEICVGSWHVAQQQGTIYTTNFQALNQFIKENEADIKKYMFGVK